MSEYTLTHEELLVYPGLNGHVGACHLRVYEHRRDQPVCMIGSFDELIGTAMQIAIESVATVISQRIGTTRFTLIEWWPHTSVPFVEVRPRHVRAKKLPFGRLLMLGDNGTVELDRTRHVRVRFADPQWDAWSGERIAEVLGADVLEELEELAGEPGEYEPARVFGVSGRARIAAAHAHNNEAVRNMIAQLAETGIR